MHKCSQIASTSELHGVYKKNNEFESAQISVRSVKRVKDRSRRVREYHESIELSELSYANQDTSGAGVSHSLGIGLVKPDLVKNGTSKESLQTLENSNQSLRTRPLSADHDATAPEGGNSSLQELHECSLSNHVETSSTQAEPSLRNLLHSNESIQQGPLQKTCRHRISRVRCDIRELDTSIRRFTEPFLECEGSSHHIDLQSLHALQPNGPTEPELPRDHQRTSWKKLSGILQESGLVQQCIYCSLLDEYSLDHVNPSSNGSVHLRLRTKIFDQGTSNVREPIVIDLPEYNSINQRCSCCGNAEELVKGGNQYSNEPTQKRHSVDVIQQEDIVVGETSLREPQPLQPLQPNEHTEPELKVQESGLVQQCVYCSSLGEYSLEHVNTSSNGTVHLRLQTKIFDQGTSQFREPIVIDLPERNSINQQWLCCSSAEKTLQNGNHYSNEPTQLRNFLDVIQQEDIVIGETSLGEPQSQQPLQPNEPNGPELKVLESGLVEQCIYCSSLGEYSLDHVNPSSNGSVHLRLQTQIFDQATSNVREPIVIDLPEYNSINQRCSCCSNAEELVKGGNQYSNEPTQKRHSVDVIQQEDIVVGETPLGEPQSLQPLQPNEPTEPELKVGESGLVQQCIYCSSLDEYSLEHVNPSSNGSVHLRLQTRIFDQGTSNVREPIVIDLPEYNSINQRCSCCSNAEELVQGGNQYSNEPTQLRHFVDAIQQEAIVVGETSLREPLETCSLLQHCPQCSAHGEDRIKQTSLNSSGSFQLRPLTDQGSTIARETSSQELVEPQCSPNSTHSEESSNHVHPVTRKQPKSIEAIQLRPLPKIEDQGIPRGRVPSLREIESNRSSRRFSHPAFGDGPSSQTDLPLRHCQPYSSIQQRPLPPIHENGPTHSHYTRSATHHELSSRTTILPSPAVVDSKSPKCRCTLFCTAFVITLTFVVITISVYAYYKLRSYVINMLDTSTDSPDKSKTSSPSSFYCNRSYEYHHSDWFIPTSFRQGYECEPLTVIDVVKVQRLVINGQPCDNTVNCTSLIDVYLDIVNLYGKYHFYVDNQTNIYTGRAWSCPYISGQLWVAAMVEDFSTNMKVDERERILSHFTNDVLSYGRTCGYLGDDVMTMYFNSSS